MSASTPPAERRRPEDGEARQLALGVLLSGFPGTDVPGWLADAIRDGLAGVILFAQNTPDVATTRRLTDALRACRCPDPRGEGRISGRRILRADSRSADGSRISAISRSSAANGDAAVRAGAPLPLVVAVDEEGGDVTRLQSAQGSLLPGNAALGVVDDIDLTRACGRALGRLLACAGVDLDLAPVLDVSSDPRNPVVGTRSFGADPALVARHGRAFTQGLAESVATCGKHFPGHGSTRVDSHLALPVLDVSDEVLRTRDGLPFAELIAPAGAADPGAAGSDAPVLDAVMTGHLVVPGLGPAPASLSRWATERLRAMGHEGPIITDALGMAAIADAHGLGEACVLALEAGADLLCLDAPQHRDAEGALHEALDAITAALDAGRLDPSELARSATRTAHLARPPAREATRGEGDPSPDATPDRSAPGDLDAQNDLTQQTDPAQLIDRAGQTDPAQHLDRAALIDRAQRDLATVGLEAARRAVFARVDRTQDPATGAADLAAGDGIALDGPPIIVDVRRRASFAAGRTSTTFERVLLSAQAGGEVIRPADVAELQAMLDVAPVAHEVVVLTGQAASDECEDTLLCAVLAARPRAVVVHTGVASTAPSGVARLVLAHGNSLATAIAVDELLGLRDVAATIGLDGIDDRPDSTSRDGADRSPLTTDAVTAAHTEEAR